MGKAKATQIRKPADWSEYPEYKKFWDAYNDIFWGKGGNTSYHNMLLEDEAWLRDVYLQNNANLTQLEQSYIKNISDTMGRYEEGMKGGTISVGLGNGPRTSFVPRATQRSLDARREAQLLNAYEKFATGKDQAARIKEYGEKFTPNLANISYMKVLQERGEEGQSLRTGMPITKTTGKVDTDTGLSASDWIQAGTGLLNFFAKNPDAVKLAGKGGKALWDVGSGFFDYASDMISDWWK